MFNNINNGVYRAGFATTQEAYEEAARDLFGALDELEQRLSSSAISPAPALTEADWRLFPTIRFERSIYSHFKCNLWRIEDYPNLSNYLRELYQVPGVAETVKWITSSGTITSACVNQSEPGRAARPGARFRGAARPREVCSVVIPAERSESRDP